MKYVVLLYADESVWENASPGERDRIIAAHDEFSRSATGRARIVGGEALASGDMATTLGPDTGAGRPVTDGPFAETVEQLGGLYLVEADDLDVMTGLCRLLPDYYTVEIRPVVDAP